jgi:hypothetical protein
LVGVGVLDAGGGTGLFEDDVKVIVGVIEGVGVGVGVSTSRQLAH